MDKETIDRNIQAAGESIRTADVFFYLADNALRQQITQVIVARDCEGAGEEIEKVVKMFAIYLAEQPHMIDVFEGAIAMARASALFEQSMN
jgi:hypothetical protein